MEFFVRPILPKFINIIFYSHISPSRFVPLNIFRSSFLPPCISLVSLSTHHISPLSFSCCRICPFPRLFSHFSFSLFNITLSPFPSHLFSLILNTPFSVLFLWHFSFHFLSLRFLLRHFLSFTYIFCLLSTNIHFSFSFSCLLQCLSSLPHFITFFPLFC